MKPAYLLRRLFLLIGVLVPTSLMALEDFQATYKQTTGGKIENYYYTLNVQGNAVTIVIDSKEEKWIAVCDTNMRVESVTIFHKMDIRKIELKREKNHVRFIENGIEKIKEIDSKSWFCSPHSLKPFILTSLKEKKLWIVSAQFGKDINKESGMTTLKLVAKKSKRKTVQYGGEFDEAQEVHITFDDWRSFFWKSKNWFRVNDGMLLRTEERRGPPGTPKTITELVEFKTIKNDEAY